MVTNPPNESSAGIVTGARNELISWIVANTKNESSAKIVTSGKE